MSTVNYFGNEIQWKKFQDGLREIVSEHKPGIILIEKSWCPTCKKVGARFQKDTELLELSKNFVMICCCDDEEPDFEEFHPDGAYYPRFFFVDKEGNIDYNISGAPEGEIYRYFYSITDNFKENMRKVLNK